MSLTHFFRQQFIHFLLFYSGKVLIKFKFSLKLNSRINKDRDKMKKKIVILRSIIIANRISRLEFLRRVADEWKTRVKQCVAII